MLERGPAVICCGSLVLDHVFEVECIPRQARKIAASRYRESGGGLAATAAAAAAALGGDVAFWGVVGDDRASAAAADHLEASGVDISGLVRSDAARTPVSTVLLDRAGERLLAYFPGDRPAGAEMGLPLHLLSSAGAVLADIRWPEGALRTLEAARELGIPSVLDVEVSIDGRLPDLVGRSGHAIFSRDGLEKLTGERDPEHGLRSAGGMTRGIVGVTLGADGYLWLEGEQLHREPAFGIAVRDTNGAGDTFHGAYALAIAEGRPVADAARFANAAAALKCANGQGWLGMPTRHDVESLIAEREHYEDDAR